MVDEVDARINLAANPAAYPGARLQRVGVLATGTALAGSAVLIGVFDPSSSGSRFPGCVFRAATGLWCPGCGLTRGTHHLLRGDLAAALGSNVFTPLVLAAITVSWLLWARRSFSRTGIQGSSGGRHRSTWPRLQQPLTRLAPLLLVVVVAYGALRNLPVPALRALAP